MSRDDIMDIYSMFADDETAKEVAEGIKWFLPDLNKKNMEEMQAIAVSGKGFIMKIYKKIQKSIRVVF